MNAITQIEAETQPERLARHLRLCRELADLAMGLARAAAAQATAAQNTPQDAAPDEPQTAEQDSAPPPPPARNPDPALSFARLATVVRQVIALEARLAAGYFAPQAPTAAHAAPKPDDPRRAALQTIIEDVTEKHPSRTIIRREALALADREIAADPEAEATAADILETLCEEIGLHIDYARLPDRTLDLICPPFAQTTGPPS